MITLRTLDIIETKDALRSLPEGKLLINTINAHSYNTALKDSLFAEALAKGDVLIPDGVSIPWACRWLKARSRPKERIAGWDLFEFEMKRLELLSEKTKSEEWKIFIQAKGDVHGQFRERTDSDKAAGGKGIPGHRSGDLLAAL